MPGLTLSRIGPFGGVFSDLAAGAGAETPTVVLGSVPEPSLFGQPVTFTVTVSGGLGTPTGFVQLQDGGVDFGASLSLSSGTASKVISTLAVGTHNMTADYGGDGVYDVATSNTDAHVVDPNTTTVGGLATICRIDNLSLRV